MFLGAGVVLMGTDYAHREIHSRGLRDGFSVGLSTLRTVWGVVRGDPLYTQAVAMKITLDEAPPRQHASLILAVSTLQRLALGMSPFWGTGSGAIRLTLIEQHASKFLRTFISIIRGRPNRNAIPESGYFSHNVQKLQLNLVGRLNLDGEIINANGDITVEATPVLEFFKL